MINERDPKWAGKRLGSCGTVTIGQAGCLLCVFAAIMSRDTPAQKGWPTAPDWMNDDLVNKGLFIDCNLLSDQALQQAYPDKIAKVVQRWPVNGVLDLSTFNDHDNWHYVCVPVTDHVHFLVVSGWDGKTLLVDDPWTGRDLVPFPQATGGSPDPARGILRAVTVIRQPPPADPSAVRLARAKQLAQQIVNL